MIKRLLAIYGISICVCKSLRCAVLTTSLYTVYHLGFCVPCALRFIPLADLFRISLVACVLAFGFSQAVAEETTIPNLVGKWQGENKTYSEAKGYQSWTKTIEITEQKERIFKGKFTYFGGTKDFFGIIYPDNSFTWVSRPAKGYVNGKIQSGSQMTACYVESGENATVGCSELQRQ